MNTLFNWLGRAGRNPVRLEAKSNAGLIAFHGTAAASWSAVGVGGLENGYCRNPIVYRCVRMISEAAASIPLKACEGRIDCDEHPLLELLSRPNDQSRGNHLIETVFGHLLISGNAYLMLVELEGTPRELHVLDPRKVHPVLDGSGYPKAYDYKVGSRSQRFEMGEAAMLLHLRLFNPADEVSGLPPLSAAHMALDIHNTASAWNKSLLDNSARPSGALVYASSAGENLSDDQFSRLKEELEDGYSGASRAGRPMVLEGGLDWKAMGYSPKDMDILEAKNGAAREIALAFGVPPMLLGIPGDNTYSNYQEANRAFWTQTVLPLATRTAQDIGAWLSVWFEDGVSLRPDTENIAALSNEREAHWARIGSADFLTANEKREALGFAPIDEEINLQENSHA